MIGEVDVAVHPPHPHPLDPFHSGRLITRRTESGVSIIAADQHILLDCGFLWDLVANSEVFESWVKFFPPEQKLDMDANFNVNPLIGITGLHELPTNKPTLADPRPMCQHWTMVVKVSGRTVAYRIGAFRPSINAMEASWVD